MSDDHRLALVELVFATPMAFQDFLRSQAKALGVALPPQSNAPSSPATQAGPPGTGPSAFAAPSAAQTAMEAAVPELKIFERGKASEQDILTEFRKHKANFSFGVGSVRVQ